MADPAADDPQSATTTNNDPAATAAAETPVPAESVKVAGQDSSDAGPGSVGTEPADAETAGGSDGAGGADGAGGSDAGGGNSQPAPRGRAEGTATVPAPAGNEGTAEDRAELPVAAAGESQKAGAAAAAPSPVDDDGDAPGHNITTPATASQGTDSPPPAVAVTASAGGREQHVKQWHAQIGQHIGSGNPHKGRGAHAAVASSDDGGRGDDRPAGKKGSRVEHRDEGILEDRSPRAADDAAAEGGRIPGARGIGETGKDVGKSPRSHNVGKWREEVGRHLGAGSGDTAAVGDYAAGSTTATLRAENAEDAVRREPDSPIRESATLVASTPSRKFNTGGGAHRDDNPEEGNDEAGGEEQRGEQGTGGQRQEKEQDPRQQTADAATEAARVGDAEHEQPTAGPEPATEAAEGDADTPNSSADGRRLATLKELTVSPLLAAPAAPRPVFVVVGSTAGMTHADHRRFHNLMRGGVARAAVHVDALVIDATDDPFQGGVLQGLFAALASHHHQRDHPSGSGGDGSGGDDGAGDAEASAAGAAAGASSTAAPRPWVPMMKLCIRGGAAAAGAAAGGRGGGREGPVVVQSATAAAFDAALREVVQRASTPPADPAGQLVDRACEVVLLVFGNPAPATAATTRGTARQQQQQHRQQRHQFKATSAALRALRALASQHTHRDMPMVDFRLPADRASVPKRVGVALSAYEEAFDFTVSKKLSAEQVASALHVITTLPSLRGRLAV